MINIYLTLILSMLVVGTAEAQYAFQGYVVRSQLLPPVESQIFQFELTTRGCNWALNYTSPDASATSSFIDGVLYKTFRNGRTNDLNASIRRTEFPAEATHNILPALFTGLASSCYFELDPETIGCPFITESGKFQVAYHYESIAKKQRLPKRIIYYCDGFRGARKWPAPFDNGFKFAQFDVIRTGPSPDQVSLLPFEFQVQKFLPKGSQNSNDLQAVFTVLVVVTNCANFSSAITLPPLPETSVNTFDFRFNAQPATYRTNVWLSETEVRTLPAFAQVESVIRAEGGNRASTGAIAWLFGGFSAIAILFAMARRRGINKTV